MTKEEFDNLLEFELIRRGLIQSVDEDGDEEWDPQILYWAKISFIDGVKWAFEQLLTNTK
jgi:hypothetical protein